MAQRSVWDREIVSPILTSPTILSTETVMTDAMQQALNLASFHPGIRVLVAYPTYGEARNEAHAAYTRCPGSVFNAALNHVVLANNSSVTAAAVVTYEDAQKFLSSEFHKVHVADDERITPAAFNLLLKRERLRIAPKDPICKHCLLPKSTHIQAYSVPAIWVCQVTTFEPV